MRAFLFLFLILAISKIQAGQVSRPFAVAMAKLGQDGVLTDAMNYLQSKLGRPNVTDVRYDSETDRFYWKGPATGKTMSMDRERFMREVFVPYDRSDLDPKVTTLNAYFTEAFNALQDTLHRPHVDGVWYDYKCDCIRWTGPVTGIQMSMDRESFMREIWYPYDLSHPIN